MMIQDLLFIFTLLPGLFASHGVLPTQDKQHKTDKVLPKLMDEPGWSLLDEATGDLNKDGHKDFVAVLECSQPHCKTQRKKLVVFQGSEHGFHKVMEASELFYQSDIDPDTDPFDEISIKNGKLAVRFSGKDGHQWKERYVFQHFAVSKKLKMRLVHFVSLQKEGNRSFSKQATKVEVNLQNKTKTTIEMSDKTMFVEKKQKLPLKMLFLEAFDVENKPAWML